MTEETAGREKQTRGAAASGIAKRGWARDVIRSITGRKRAEEALRASEERYRDLVRNVNDVIFEIDTGGRVTFISPAIEAATGHSPAEMIGRSFTEFLHPVDLPATIDKAQKRLSGDREPNEYRLLTKSGEACWVQSLGRPILEGDRVVGFHGVLTDITERKQAEEALRESEERYRNLVEAARDVIYSISTDGTLLSLNSAFETITGWSRAEWLGKPFAGIIHPDDLPVTMENFQRMVQGEAPPVTEIRVLAKSGEYLTGEFATRPLIIGGEVVSSFGIVRDITERKRAEEALRESERRLRGLYEAAIEGIVIHEKGVIVDANVAFEKLHGYPLSELIGMSVIELAAKESRALIEEKVRSETQQPYEAVGLRKDGTTFRATISSKDHMYRGRSVRVAAVHDITEHKRAEELVRQAEQRYRDLFERAPVMYVTTRNEDGNPIVADCNELFLSTLGYTRAEVLERPLADFYTHASRAELLERGGYQRALKGGFPAEERQLLTRDGCLVQTLLRALPETDPDGHVFGTRAMFVDVTERRRAEEALRESEEKYRDLVENINDIVYAVDEHGRITYVSPAVGDVGGYNPSEIIGRSLADFVHPDDLAMALDALRRNMSGQSEPAEFRMLDTWGKVHWMRAFGRTIRDGDRVVGLRGVLMDITERKRAEEALRESEERYRELTDSITDVFFAMDRDLRYTYWNKASENLTGISAEDAIGKSLYELFPEVKGTKADRLYHEVLRTRQPRSFVNEHRLGDRDFFFEINAYPSTTGLSVFVKDITERKRTEEALRESEKKYRNLVENVNDVIYEADVSGRITYISPVIEQRSGYTLAEIMGRPATEFVHPDDVASIMEGLQRNLSGNPEPNEYRLLSKSGEIHWVRSFSRPIFERDRVIGLRGVATDITERKRGEEALRQSEEKYRDLVENLNDIIYEVDADGRITYVSRATQGVGAYSPSEITGRLFTELLHPDDIQAFVENFREAASSGLSHPNEYRVLSKTGETLWFRTNGRPVFEGDQIVGFRGVLADITHRKRAEEALQKAREELEARVERQLLRRNPYSLTFRELTLLHLVAAGRSDKEIGAELGISPLTAQKHISNILGKMRAASRTEAGVRAVREGLLD